MGAPSVALYMPRRFRATAEGSTQKMPLELLTLAGPLLQSGYDVKIIDANIERDGPAALLDACRGAVCLGISCILGYQIIDGRQTALEVRRKFPALPIVWGGWFPSVRPELFLKDGIADLVVIGQGEKTFLELVERLSNGASTEDVQGIALKTNGRVLHTPPRRVCDLENLPPVPFSMLDYEAYYRSDPGVPLVRYFWAAAKNRMWPRQDMRLLWYMSSWGCPNQCGFCCSKGVTRRRWTALTPQRILDELGPLTAQNRVDTVNFCDANFFVDRRRVLDLCRAKQDRKMGFHWIASAEPEIVVQMSGSDLTALAESGCFCLFVGAESGSEETLRRMNKGHAPGNNEACAERLLRHGIAPILSYIVGVPGESPDSVKMTIEQCRKIKTAHPKAVITILHYLPLPGSGLYEDAVRAGFVEPKTLEEWGEIGERSYYGGPTFNNLKRSQARTVDHVRYFYFHVMDLPLYKARLGLAESVLRRLAAARLRYGLLGMPVEFRAALAMRRVLRAAAKLVRHRGRPRVAEPPS